MLKMNAQGKFGENSDLRKKGKKHRNLGEETKKQKTEEEEKEQHKTSECKSVSGESKATEQGPGWPSGERLYEVSRHDRGASIQHLPWTSRWNNWYYSLALHRLLYLLL